MTSLGVAIGRALGKAVQLAVSCKQIFMAAILMPLLFAYATSSAASHAMPSHSRDLDRAECRFRFQSNVLCMYAGKRCVELGSGTGLLGIALSRVGADYVLLTDGDPSALDNCRHNLAGNDITIAPEENIDCATSGCQVNACPYIQLSGLICAPG